MSDVTGTYYEGDAIHGYGAEWLIGNGAVPEVFNAVADVESITFGDMTTAIIEKTHLRSPNAHREKLAGLRDSGPFVMRCNYRPTHESQNLAGGGAGVFSAGGLAYFWKNRTEKNHIIRLNDGSPATEFPFSGVITRYQPGEVGRDGKIDLTVEVTPITDFSADLP